MALLVRGLTALALPHPGYIDATYALHVAAGLLAGRGLSEEVVWNHLWTAPTLPRPSNAYWPPGPALFAAAGGLLLPDEPAPLAPGPGPARPGRRPAGGRDVRHGPAPLRPSASPRRAPVAPADAGLPAPPAAAHLAAAFVLGSGAYFPYWVTTDSFTPFALAAGGSLWLAVEAHKRLQHGDARHPGEPAPVWCCLFGAGALAGLAQGVRADGLLFLVAPLLAALSRPAGRAVWAPEATRLARGVALVLAGAALTAGPLALRAVLTWGTPGAPRHGRGPLADRIRRPLPLRPGADVRALARRGAGTGRPRRGERPC